MYKFTLRHRVTSGANIVNPRGFIQGAYIGTDGVVTLDSTKAYSELIEVTATQIYQSHVSVGTTFYRITYYNNNKRYLSEVTIPTAVFTIPASAYYMRISAVSESSGEDMYSVGMTLGSGSAFVDYFTSRIVNPIYKSLNREYGLEANSQYYREKLNGNMKFLRDDYDYISTIAFDTKLLLLIEDLDDVFLDYNAFFYKTDCKFNDDDKSIEVTTKVDDLYYDILGGYDKTFNLVELAPQLQEITVRRRPVIQVYVAGDNTITNILGGTSWEQEIQIDPEFDDSELTGTYHFYNAKNLRTIPADYAPSLSTDVTGDYDGSLVNLNGLYKIVSELNVQLPFYVTTRYKLQRVSDSVTLYQTPYTDIANPSINFLLFSGVGGETGEFYFSEYRIYVRYYTDLLNVRGTDTYEVPVDDIIANNSNYKRVVGYNITDFFMYDEFVTYPTKFGRVPDGTPNTGEYYKEYLVSVASGVSNPLPISHSNWKAVGLWFFNNTDIRYTEFIDGQDFILRDTYPLSGVIQALLTAVGSEVTFKNTTDYSEFLYATTNPLGGFTFLDFDGGSLLSDYAGNLDYFITQKSNIISSNYTNAAQKAEASLNMILKMLKDTLKLYWHIDGGKLRVEHIKYYQNGGSYTAPVIGKDLTNLIQPRNNKNWSYLTNKWEYDKVNMPERFEFGWMDDVSKPFDGNNIQILSEFVQKGNVEDLRVGGFTTDIDFVQATPQEISKDGFCLISTVLKDGIYRVPFIEMDIGSNQEVVMQNGFLSYLYLHPKYFIYDLPADKVNINNTDMVLYDNNTRQKKQEVTYPAGESIDPYKLVKTNLGDGIVSKLSVNMESNIVKATIKHDTE